VCSLHDKEGCRRNNKMKGREERVPICHNMCAELDTTNNTHNLGFGGRGGLVDCVMVV
jgi:hypothetical protein